MPIFELYDRRRMTYRILPVMADAEGINQLEGAIVLFEFGDDVMV